MNKLEYIKLVLQLKLFTKKAWMISAFSITRDDMTSPYHGKLIRQPWGMCFLDEDLNTQVKIEGTKPDEILFSFKDIVTVTPEMAPNLAAPIESTIGNLLFNHISIIPSFGNKFPYVTGRVNVGKLEDIIASRLQDTPASESQRSNQYFYVDEYIKFVDSLQFLSTLTQITTWSATKKSILPPPGITEFKKGLIEKYKGQLTDPVVLSKFEAELLAYDDQYLKDDPAYGTFIAGKIKNTARKKLHLTIGSERGFDEGLEVVPITNSLNEGWPTSPAEFTASMNGIRSGSFSRGAETVNGGVSAKYLLRAANNFKILDKDCQSKLGIHRTFTDDNINQLEGRYIVEGSRSLLVTKETSKNYVGRNLIVRSPMYCRENGDNLCKICTGVKLANYPTGLTIPLTEISAIILNASLKIMHTSGTQTAKLDINKSLT